MEQIDNMATVSTTTDQKNVDARDPWTGGVEWNKIFNIRNLIWTVIIMILIYWFLKKMLPLIKTSIAK